jgi:hypothetical protein
MYFWGGLGVQVAEGEITGAIDSRGHKELGARLLSTR